MNYYCRGLHSAQFNVSFSVTFVKERFAVGTPVARRPPHRSVLEALPHTAPTLGYSRKASHWDMDAVLWL